MSAFRIEESRGGYALRVIHGPGEKRAAALILAEPDGSVCLFPVEFDHPPAPLTGSSMNFPNVAAVRVYLGIPEDAREAA